MNKITVIIPIYNSEKFLPCLFEALEKCNFNSGDEVLLVDNGSSDASVALCKEKAEQYPEIYCFLSYTKKAGAYATRNYAIKQAKGDIFVFTDSDCKPTAEWLDEIRKNIKSGEIIAGKVQIEVENNGLWERFDSIAHLNSERNAKDNRVATANMAVFREDYFKVGIFEERFSGGDYEWSMRAAQVGMQIRFISTIMVYHPSRKSFLEILRKEQRIAYGEGKHQKLKNKSYYALFVRYALKIFKLDTNIRYSKQLKKAGIRSKEILEFNKKFMRIRIEQLKFAVKGYKQEDVRKIGIT